MEDKESRKVEWILSLGFCEPGSKPVEFTNSIMGTISESIRGDKGFGFDPIFIPEGQTATMGEDPELRDSLSPFNDLIIKFAEWQKKNK